MKRCMYCGQENDDSASSCVKCGNPLLDMPAEEEDTIEEMEFDEVPDLQPAKAETEEVLEEILYEEDKPTAPAASEPVQETQQPESGVPGTVKAASEEAAYVEEEEVSIPDAQPQPETQEVPTVDEISFDEAEPNDVGRGQTYAARAQYDAQGEQDADDNNDFVYDTADEGMSEYGGQAYGYPEQEPEMYEDEPADDEEADEVPAGNAQITRKSRKLIKSALFFLAALIFTVSVFAEIANIVSGAAVENLSTVTATIKNLIGDNMIIGIMTSTVIPTVHKYQEQNALLIPAIGIGLAIPQLFIVCGLWMAFNSISPKRQQVSTAGLTMIRVMEILKFIFTCLALLAVIGLTVSFVVAAAAAGPNGSMMSLILGIITLLVVVIVAVFVIMYYVQLIFSVRAIRTNVRNGESVGRIPGFVIFIGFLCCLVTVASMLPMAPDDYIGLAARGSKALWLLLITLWALVYRLMVRVKHN